MSQVNDTALISFQTKYGKNFGAGAIPWQAILAALASLLSGCVVPAASNVKAQIKRPLVQVRIRRRLLDSGVPRNSVEAAVAATVKTVEECTDAEICDLCAAACETD